MPWQQQPISDIVVEMPESAAVRVIKALITHHPTFLDPAFYGLTSQDGCVAHPLAVVAFLGRTGVVEVLLTSGLPYVEESAAAVASGLLYFCGNAAQCAAWRKQWASLELLLRHTKVSVTAKHTGPLPQSQRPLLSVVDLVKFKKCPDRKVLLLVKAAAGREKEAATSGASAAAGAASSNAFEDVLLAEEADARAATREGKKKAKKRAAKKRAKAKKKAAAASGAVE